MDGFFNIRAEKQEHIINAALAVFSRNGYKKASIADIAQEAGIAKGMINYYFGSKKNLYLYLVEFCGNLVMEQIGSHGDGQVQDFFDNMKMLIHRKMEMVKEHPALFSFLASAYSEQAKEVTDEISQILSDSMKQREGWLYGGVDISRFKDDVDPLLIDKFLVLVSERFSDNMQSRLLLDEVESLVKDIYTMIDLMKKYFYKEENEEAEEAEKTAPQAKA